MKILKFFSTILLFILAGTLYTGCEKNNDQSDDTDLSAAKDYALAEGIFEDIHTIADEGLYGTDKGFKSTEGDGILGHCATVTIDTMAFPHVMTIDFGDTNCLCNDGRYRRGIINVSFTGRYREPGTVITITTDNYFVNDNQVICTRVIENEGRNESGFLTFSIHVEGSIILANNQGTLNWTTYKNKKWIEGEFTPRLRDDVYLITGTATGTRPSGMIFTKAIIKPLRKELSCRYFVSGTVEIIPEGRPTRLLDYGDGICDDQATVTINGRTFTITLH